MPTLALQSQPLRTPHSPQRCYHNPSSRQVSQQPRRLSIRRLSSAKSTTGALRSEQALSFTEQDLLNDFEQRVTGDGEGPAHKVLVEAVTNRRVRADEVLGALLYLEAQYESKTQHADMLSRLEGPWRLVFSGPSKIKSLSYIPVDEDFIIDSSSSSLKLESDLGPFRAKFGGSFTWRGDQNKMDFSFTTAEVDFLGRSVWKREVGFKPKTYSFFWQQEDVACARSSGGTLTLLKRL